MSEGTCAVGTPSEYGCFVLQLALQAPGSEKRTFKTSMTLKTLEETVQLSFGPGNSLDFYAQLGNGR
jgi:hypothetical protein